MTDDSDQTPAQRRRAKERQDARATILDAAQAIGRRDGWDAVTMRRLADEIEYSANFAYRYFTGRDDILLTLVKGGFTALRTAMVDATAHADSAQDAVRRAGHAYLDYALSEPELYQLMYSVGGVRVSAADAWNDGQAVGDVFIQLLAAVGDDAPESHVLRLWATAHGLIALRVVGRLDVDTDALHALIDDAINDCLQHALSKESK